MSANAATGLLARMLFGISQSARPVDPEEPDFGGDFEATNAYTVAAKITLPAGDTYRVTVEWLAEESP